MTDFDIDGWTLTDNGDGTYEATSENSSIYCNVKPSVSGPEVHLTLSVMIDGSMADRERTETVGSRDAVEPFLEELAKQIEAGEYRHF